MAKAIILLNAEKRELLGNKVRALRRSGVMPAVLYGHGIAAQSLQLDARTFEKAYKQAGESTLVDLQIGSAAPIKVLIQDVAKHYLTLKPIHADLYQVSMTEKLDATVQLKFIGEAPAVKELGGVLVKNLQEIDIKCLPQDLMSEIPVDVTVLKTFDNVILVKDLPIGEGVTVLTSPDEVVVLAQAPKAEEEVVAPVDEKAKIEEIKVATDEKKAEKAEKAEKEKEEKEK